MGLTLVWGINFISQYIMFLKKEEQVALLNP